MFLKIIKILLYFIVFLLLGCGNSYENKQLDIQKQIFNSNDFQTILDSWDSLCAAEKLDTNSLLVEGAKAYRAGSRLLFSDKFDEAKDIISKAEDCFTQIDYKEALGYAHIVKASVYQALQMSDSALWHFALSKNIFASLRDTMGMIITCNNLGIYLFELGALSMAYDNYLNARDFTRPETFNWLVVEFNIANYYAEQKDTASIRLAHDMLIDLLAYSQILDSLNYSRIYSSLAAIEIKFNNGKKALDYVKKSLEFMPNADFSFSHVQYLNKAHALLLTKQFVEFEGIMNFLEKRYDQMSLNGKQHFKLLRILEQMRSDYQYMDQFILLADSIQDRGYSNKLSMVQRKVEIEQQQGQIETLAKSNDAQRDRMRQNAIITSVIFVFLLILAGMSLYMHREGKRCRRSRELLRIEQEKSVLMNQELAEALYVKNRLMAIVAHDLRGPMGGLLQLIEVYSMMPDMTAEDADRLFKNLREASVSIYHLLDNLLLWANNQNGENHFKPENQNVVPIIDAAIADVGGWALLKNIKIEFDSESEISALVDKNMLKTIVRNLLSNAIKFSGNDSSIQVQATLNASELLVSITDHGKGMSSQQLSRIFSSNGSTDKLSDEKPLGFGLIVCRDFVRNHNGRLGAESELGKGSRVWFSLPVN